MYTLQGPPGEIERPTQQDQRNFDKAVVWFIRLLVISYVASVVVILWKDDETRLHFLHGATSTLHTVAHTVGSMSVKMEDLYYKHADTLHS